MVRRALEVIVKKKLVPLLADNAAVILEGAGALAILVAIGVMLSPWIALAAGGTLAVVVGYLLEAKASAGSPDGANTEQPE